MIFNLKPCWVGESSGNNPDKPGTTSYAARCPVHEWEVRRDIPSYLPDGEWNGEGVRWSRNEARKHEDLFRRIAVARARAQVALDAELQRLAAVGTAIQRYREAKATWEACGMTLVNLGSAPYAPEAIKAAYDQYQEAEGQRNRLQGQQEGQMREAWLNSLSGQVQENEGD